MVLVLAVTLVLLVAAVVGAAGVGSWDRAGDERSATLPPVTADPVTLPSGPTDAGLPGDIRLPEAEPGLARGIVYGLVGIMVIGLVLLLLQFLRQLRRAAQAPPPVDDRLVGLAVEDPTVPELQEGIARAQAQMDDETREPRDAVMRAWVALEAAAERGGAKRRPAQTPTEFTAAVLARTPADHDAVGVLCGLYLRGRFSDDVLDADDAAAARRALATVAASWSGMQAAP